MVKLMVRLVNINPDKAFCMTGVLLELKPQKEDSYFSEAISNFENFQYEELIKTYLKEFCEKLPVRSAIVILNVLVPLTNVLLEGSIS